MFWRKPKEKNEDDTELELTFDETIVQHKKKLEESKEKRNELDKIIGEIRARNLTNDH